MTVVETPTRRRRARRRHRPWQQRAVIIAGSLLTGVLLVSACAVWYVDQWYAGIDRITIVHAAPTTAVTAEPVLGGQPAPTVPTPTTEADLGPSKAMNVLLTGSDGRSCLDPDSPYAGAFSSGGSPGGNRSDTIILMHLDPAQKQLALLSFPRDLWVPIAGGKTKSRINSAFDAENPNPLIQTIESVFGVHIDHYIGVDFCAFKSLVDATGGIQIPFEFPARDTHTGLFVEEPGCHAMAGDEALAYVRSRYYEYKDGNRWVSDGSSDYGRIARQQDFIRRLAARALDKGATNPLTAKRLLDVAHESNVKIDDGLSLSDLIRIARSIRDLGPDNAQSYRVEGLGQVIGGASVIVPDLTSPASKEILGIFRGEAPAPAATTTTAAPTTKATPTTAAAAATEQAPADAAPPADATPTTTPNNMRGVYPPPDASCH